MDRIIQWNKSFVIHRNSTFNIFLQDFLLLLLLLCDGKEIYLLSVQNCPEKPFLIYDATPSWWWWSLLLIKIEIDFFHFFIHFTVINWQVFFRFFHLERFHFVSKDRIKKGRERDFKFMIRELSVEKKITIKFTANRMNKKERFQLYLLLFFQSLNSRKKFGEKYQFLWIFLTLLFFCCQWYNQQMMVFWKLFILFFFIKTKNQDNSITIVVE